MARNRRGPFVFSLALEGLPAGSPSWTGTSQAFVIGVGVSVSWALTGPFFYFSDT